MIFRLPALAVLAIVITGGIAGGEERRVLFVSLDGLGYQNLTRDPAAKQLTTLHRLARGGFLAPLQTSFPSKTAPAHAALFTGAWSGVNGIFSNNTPRSPRGQYALHETVSGFRSDALAAEPIWTAAARQGLSAVAYQAPQLYPFGELSAGKAVAINGYQSWTIAPQRVIGSKDLQGEIWKDGPLTFQVTRRSRGLRIACGAAFVEVDAAPEETTPPRGRALARRFSKPLPVEANGIRTAVYFRLFEISGDDFVLFRTAAQELAVSSNLAFNVQTAEGPFVGNSATGLYQRGSFGKTLAEGGDGRAERRYLETLELVVRQITRQTIALDRVLKPRLMVGYYPVVDDLEHAWFGLSLTGTPAIDTYRAWGYAALDEGLKQLTARFARDAVVFASDHGMAGITHEVRMPALLRDAGFSKDMLVPNSTCLFVNTTDWKDGVVEPANKPRLLADAEAKLKSTGLFTRFYLKDELAWRFGLNGPSSPDLCFDLKPRYYPVESQREPAISPHPHARGEHGFDPLRAEMQSYVLLWGHGLDLNSDVKNKARVCLDDLRAIDVAPTVAAMLGIQPPAQTQGHPIGCIAKPLAP